MSSILKVDGLSKHYPAFSLDSVSFDLAPGKITGFIGRNGAGKTTTLKSLMNYIHPSEGRIEFFGLPFSENEAAIRQRVGFVSGGIDFYTGKKIRLIFDVTKRFYPQWDEAACRKYLQLFSLDPEKTPAELSAGMKVKCSLALALSHHADLLILDEPTSGLDPVSREEILEIFLTLSDQGKTILFSTHITSDLDKCADRILYLRGGKLLADSPLEEFISHYRIAEFPGEVPEAVTRYALGICRVHHGHTVLLNAENPGTGVLNTRSSEALRRAGGSKSTKGDDIKSKLPENAPPDGLEDTLLRTATLEEIMVHLEKEAGHEESAE